MTWRPLPARREERDPRPLGASLDSVSQSLGAPPARTLTTVFAHWDELVGQAMAAHVRPLSLAGGALVVAVDHPSWATQVRWLAPQLLARLAEATGQELVTHLEVRVR